MQTELKSVLHSFLLHSQIVSDITISSMHPFETNGISPGIYLHNVGKTQWRTEWEKKTPSQRRHRVVTQFSAQPTQQGGHSLEVLVQRQGDLWRHVDEALAQQQPHGLAGVAQDLLQLLRHAGRRVLLAAIQEELPHLLHTLHVLSTSQASVPRQVSHRCRSLEHTSVHVKVHATMEKKN